MSTSFEPLQRSKIYIVFIAINLFVSGFRIFLFPDQGWPFHVTVFFLSLIGFFIIWECILFFGRLLEKQFPVSSSPVARIVCQVLLTYIFIIIIGEFIFRSTAAFFHMQIPQLLTTVAFLFFFMMSVVLNLIYFGTVYFFQWKENLLRNERLQREHAQVKYDALRNHLNPHFLFNALTSLNSLIFENQQLASDFLQQLSKVYRYTLQNKEKETVALKTELDFISNYIFLFKTRFENAIDFKIELSEEAKSKGIVPVTLQLLIENAAKHNIITKEKPLLISITADDEFLKVENTINKKLRVESSNNQGLANLKALYQYLSEKPVEIIETGKTFTVKIPLF